MLVFIDESGDSGFKLTGGSSPYFVAAMVLFNRADEAIATQSCISSSEAAKIHKAEFKFSKCCNDARDAFFNDIRNCDFRVRAIVVEKRIIYSPRLMANKDQFYQYFVKSMLSHNGGTLRNAKIVIDGSGDKAFRQQIEANFRRQIGSGVVQKVAFRDSKKDRLVQLADMCAGAIARSYRTDRTDAGRWRAMLADHITNIWDFR